MSYGNYFPYTNCKPVQTGYGVYPVSRVEDVDNFPPDYQGYPTFFFNTNKNEIYSKQFDHKTGLVNLNKFVLSNEPIKNNTAKLEDEIISIRKDINKLFSVLQPQEKEVKNAESHT